MANFVVRIHIPSLQRSDTLPLIYLQTRLFWFFCACESTQRCLLSSTQSVWCGKILVEFLVQGMAALIVYEENTAVRLSVCLSVWEKENCTALRTYNIEDGTPDKVVSWLGIEPGAFQRCTHATLPLHHRTPCSFFLSVWLLATAILQVQFVLLRSVFSDLPVCLSEKKYDQLWKGSYEYMATTHGTYKTHLKSLNHRRFHQRELRRLLEAKEWT